MKASKHFFALIISFATIADGIQQASDLSGEWTRYSPEKCGLSIELPGRPQKVDVPIPENAQQHFHYLNGYLYQGGEITVFISHTSATEHLPPKSIVEGVVKGLIARPDVSDFIYSTEPSTESKAPVKGSYKQNGIAQEIDGIALSHQTHAWLVIVGSKQANKEAPTVKKRILDSIKLDGPPCPDRKDVIGQATGPDAGWAAGSGGRIARFAGVVPGRIRRSGGSR